jgi:glycosyltransferase involved in cell wall biosynthesis
MSDEETRGGAASAPSRSVLFVAYFYPPCPDTGAHRPAAMVKYLRRAGHRVTVLTTSAYGEEAGESDVVRTSDLQRMRARLRGHDRLQGMFDSDTYSGRPHPLSRVLVPEPLVAAWVPFAIRRARRLHAERGFDCVVTSSPPESAHLVGRALARRGVPWVADVRDAWNFEPLRPRFPTAAQRRLDERLERSLLGDADAVTVVSRPVAEDLRERVGVESLLVPNAWDPDLAPGDDGDSDEAADLLDPARTSLLYTGRFGSYGRDPGPLVRALRDLAAQDPGVAGRLELAIAGPVTDGERRLLGADVFPARITLLGTLPRAEVLRLQRRADALLLLAARERSQLANLKLFEYLAAGRPILALAAGTEAGRIVLETKAGEVVPSKDVSAIKSALRRLVAGELTAPDPRVLAPYTYPAAGERMARAVETAIGRSHGRHATDSARPGEPAANQGS